jgi:hypothetical protein
MDGDAQGTQMKLIMCCQLIEGRDFQEDIKFSVVAAAFWKRIYPEGEAFVATNATDKIPYRYRQNLKIIDFRFDNFPPAFGRTVFMNSYVSSSLFDQDTVFAGHDVLFLNPLPAFDAKVITNYRYHPTQPYCSDLLICRDKEYSKYLLQELCDAHGGMPRPILDGPADQLAYALTLGMPEKNQFNGKPFYAPRRSDVWVVPADKYLFTPNDFFPPCYQDYGKLTPNLTQEEMMEAKIAVHFKGNRKDDFFKFGQWAYGKGYVNLDMLED